MIKMLVLVFRFHSHILVKTPSATALPAHFDGYVFTGPLRPGIVSPRRTVPNHIPRPDYAETGEPLGERSAKSGTIVQNTPEQIEGIRAACKVQLYDKLSIIRRIINSFSKYSRSSTNYQVLN